MEIHHCFGPSLPEDGWVPAPRYLLRRQLILKILGAVEVGHVLDIGCGPAIVLYELAKRGWSCCALEQSPSALEMARKLHDFPGGAHVYTKSSDSWADAFDWVLVMEVLEHIEDDFAALSLWKQWIKPNGRILLSVPAHPKSWSSSDVWAGHYRRYEREQLVTLFTEAGYAVESVMSYGFPLANLIKPFRTFSHRKMLRNCETVEPEDLDKRSQSDKSGTCRSLETRLYPYYSGFAGVLCMKIAFALQQMFLHTDLGTGYLIKARRLS